VRASARPEVEVAMDPSNILSRQGQRLLQLGVALFLFTSFEGFVIPYFAAPVLGRSAHSLCALLGVMLIAFGLLWPRLILGETAAQIAFWLLIYSGFAMVFWSFCNSRLQIRAGT